MNKRHFLLATLINTVLLTIVFVALSTQVREYDPYADYNGDRKIDIKDIASTAIAYGSSGDPNRNVTVTNWPSSTNTVVWFNASAQPSYISDVYKTTLGLGELHILVHVWNLTPWNYGAINWAVNGLLWGINVIHSPMVLQFMEVE